MMKRLPEGGGGASPAAMWTTIIDHDFTADGNQALADGANVVPGFGTVYAFNNVNANELALVNGVGLRIVSNANANVYDGATHTLPLVQFKLNEFDANLTYAARRTVRVWALVTWANIDANWESLLAAIDTFGWVPQGAQAMALRMFDAPTGGQRWGFRQNNVGSGEVIDATGLADDVIVMQWDYPWLVGMLTGVSVAGAFPAPNTLTKRARATATLALGAIAAPATALMLNDDGLCFSFGAMNGGAAIAGATGVLRKLKVEFA